MCLQADQYSGARTLEALKKFADDHLSAPSAGIQTPGEVPGGQQPEVPEIPGEVPQEVLELRKLSDEVENSA